MRCCGGASQGITPGQLAFALEQDDPEVLAALTPLIEDVAIAQPDAPTNGQLLSWDSTIEEWVPSNSPGGGRLAASSNTSGTPTALTASSGTGGGIGTIVAIPGTAISVPASGGRPVVLKFSAGFSQTVAVAAPGIVTAVLFVVETTGGGNVNRGSFFQQLTNAPAAAPVTLGTYEYDLGAVASTRTFELRAYLYTTVASAGASVLNSATHPSTLRAVAE